MDSKQKKIIVAHVIGKWLGGGVEAVVMNYYRHIDTNKIQFDFICDEDSTNIPYDEIEKLGGRVIIVPPYQKLFRYQKELYKIFKLNNYKIVHSHINTLSVFPLRIAKKAGIPVRIAHSHSTTNKKEKKKHLLKQLLKPFSKVYATHFFACSELAGRWLFGDKTFDEGKVYILNNAIDVEKFAYNEKLRIKKRKELGISDDTLVIGHVGRFVEQKNHRFLIDIFDEIHKEKKDSLLLLVGQGPLEEEIKEKVKNLSLTNSVMFLGQRGDAHELYQAMDVFLLPSLYEGLPVVGVEAQASGLLCVFSDDMTKETKVLDSTILVSLSKDTNEWNNIILKYVETFIRSKNYNEITNNNFNIKYETKNLEKKYIAIDHINI
ncbi:MAG: glycosyltransferase family 1 protein [Bacilli bacterium]|nr:glycosyltransferase family 1 protein [Bacilli bacterium]